MIDFAERKRKIEETRAAIREAQFWLDHDRPVYAQRALKRALKAKS